MNFRIMILLCLAWLATTPGAAQISTIKVVRDSTLTIRLFTYRGDAQWQVSANDTVWSDIPGADKDSLRVPGSQPLSYRAGIKELFCDWIYSEQVKIRPISPVIIESRGVGVIKEDTIRCSADVVNGGNDDFIYRGFCYGLETMPDTSKATLWSQPGTGFYTDTISGLLPDTVYYIRAFAGNLSGIVYGRQDTLRTGIFIPRLRSIQINVLSDSTAAGTGMVNMNGGSPLLETGFCWSIGINPTINNDHAASLVPEETFTAQFKGLKAVTTYYARAYAMNAQGIGYGDTLSFTTPSGPPDVITRSMINLTDTSFTANGEVTSEEGATVTARGFCWDIQTDPDLNDQVVLSGGGSGTFSSVVSGLSVYTEYYVRAFATNQNGTTYGETIQVRTRARLPELTTKVVTSITPGGATSGGSITDTGGAPILKKGICWATTINPDTTASYSIINTAGNDFNFSITGLAPNQIYHIRAFAVNDEGISYGNNRSFITQVALPQVTSFSPSEISFKSAELHGEVTQNGGGSINERGFCYGTATNPDLSGTYINEGTGVGEYFASLRGLAPGTVYYVRTYAKNEAGTVYGNQVSFTSGRRTPYLAETTLPTNITFSSAESGGLIGDAGGGTILARGLCISTNPLPDISQQGTSDGTGTGAFQSTLAGLEANTQYYVRAFARNIAGVAYGPQQTFITRDDGSFRNVPLLTPGVRSAFKGWATPFPSLGGAAGNGFSGMTFDWERNLLYIVGNNARYIWVIHAPGFGRWSDQNPGSNFIKSIKLDGFVDPEAINYLGNSWIMIAEEAERKIYMFEINDATTVINRAHPSVVVDATPLFSTTDAASAANQLEGIAFDFFNRKVYALAEIGPSAYPRIFRWNWDDVNHQIQAGTRVEISTDLEDFTTDLDAASDLYFNPLLRRLYVIDGAGGNIIEYDVWDPASSNYGLKIGSMAVPLSQGTTGSNLGDAEGFCLSTDARYLYTAYEDRAFGYAPVQLIRNSLDAGFTPAHYPFAGTPGTGEILDPLNINDETVYLQRFSDANQRADQDLLLADWSQINSTQRQNISRASGLALDEINERIFVVEDYDATNTTNTRLHGFDLDNVAAREHIIVKGFGLKPDGSFKPAVNRSSVTELMIPVGSNLKFIWANGLDASVIQADLTGVNQNDTLMNYLNDPAVDLIHQGLDAGVILQNLYEGMAIDQSYRNCIWLVRKTTLKIDEYRAGILKRQIDLADIEVEGTTATVADMIDVIKGLHYNPLSDHLFILAHSTTTKQSVIFEMKMADRSIIGFLILPETLAEAMAFDQTLRRLAVLYREGTRVIQLYEN